MDAVLMTYNGQWPIEPKREGEREREREGGSVLSSRIDDDDDDDGDMSNANKIISFLLLST